MIKNYKYWMNESNADMDPYGEEDWNGETTREIIYDDDVYDDDYYDEMEQTPCECKICGEYSPRCLMTVEQDGLICQNCLENPDQYD